MAEAHEAEFSNPEEAVATVRQLPDPDSADQVWEQLNLIQKALGAVSPGTAYQEEILDRLDQLLEIRAGMDDDTGGGGGDGSVAGPDASIPELLSEINFRLEEQIQGITDTTDLPAGLTGNAAASIQNGQTGVAIFDIAGGEFAASVQAVEDVVVQDIIRVLPKGRNLIEPIGTRRTEDFLDPTVLPVEDMMMAANQRYAEGRRVGVGGTLNPGEEQVMAEVTVGAGVSFMLTGINATAHPDTEYRYYFDEAATDDVDLDPGDADPNLSGSAPWATPPDLFDPYEGGAVEVESSIKVQIANNSDSNILDPAQATLAGYLVEVPE